MKLKASELRIGNFVQGVRIGKVKSIFSSYFQVDDLDHISIGNSLQDSFNPIQLTEELLVRVGVKFDENTGLYHKSGFDIEFVEDGYIEFYLAEYGSWFVSLEYLHQLQNLYFDLTGEELELSPK